MSSVGFADRGRAGEPAYLVSLRAMRIAGSVKPFLVVETNVRDNLRHVARGLDRVRAELRVAAHLGPVRRSIFVPLAEQLGRKKRRAHVHEQASRASLVYIVGRQLELALEGGHPRAAGRSVARRVG